LARERKEAQEGAEETVRVRLLPGPDWYNLAAHGEPDVMKAPGDEVDVDETFAAQLIENGFAERVASE
jgi:hypothetical protein